MALKGTGQFHLGANGVTKAHLKLFSERLRALMGDTVSNGALGKHLGCSAPTVRAISKGFVLPTLKVVDGIAQFFRTTAPVLLVGLEQFYPDLRNRAVPSSIKLKDVVPAAKGTNGAHHTSPPVATAPGDEIDAIFDEAYRALDAAKKHIDAAKASLDSTKARVREKLKTSNLNVEELRKGLAGMQQLLQ